MVLERIEDLRVILGDVQRELNRIATRTTRDFSRHERTEHIRAEAPAEGARMPPPAGEV